MNFVFKIITREDDMTSVMNSSNIYTFGTSYILLSSNQKIKFDLFLDFHGHKQKYNGKII